MAYQTLSKLLLVSGILLTGWSCSEDENSSGDGNSTGGSSNAPTSNGGSIGSNTDAASSPGQIVAVEHAESIQTDNNPYAMAIGNFSELPSCTSSNEAQLVYALDQAQFYTCSSGSWVAIDINGVDGDDGADGERGAPGVQGGNGMMVYDANNTLLGNLITTVNPFTNQPGYVTIFDAPNEIQYSLSKDGVLVPGSGYSNKINYSNDDCTGVKSLEFTRSLLVNTAFSFENEVVKTSSLTPTLAKSYRVVSTGACSKITGRKINANGNGSISYASLASSAGTNHMLYAYIGDISGAVYSQCTNSCEDINNWNSVFLDTTYPDSLSLQIDSSGRIFAVYKRGAAIVVNSCSTSCLDIDNWTMAEIVGSASYAYPIGLNLSMEGSAGVISYLTRDPDISNNKLINSHTCSSDCSNAASWNPVTFDGSSRDYKNFSTSMFEGKFILYFSDGANTAREMYSLTCTADCGNKNSWASETLFSLSGTIYQDYANVEFEPGYDGTSKIYSIEQDSNLYLATCTVGSCGSPWSSTLLDDSAQYRQGSTISEANGLNLIISSERPSGSNVYNTALYSCTSNCSLPGSWTKSFFSEGLQTYYDFNMSQSMSFDGSVYHLVVGGEGLVKYLTCDTNCGQASSWESADYTHPNTYNFQPTSAISRTYEGPIRIGQ